MLGQQLHGQGKERWSDFRHQERKTPTKSRTEFSHEKARLVFCDAGMEKKSVFHADEEFVYSTFIEIRQQDGAVVVVELLFFAPPSKHLVRSSIFSPVGKNTHKVAIFCKRPWKIHPQHAFHPLSTILGLSSSYLRAKTSCQENCKEKLHPAKQKQATRVSF